LRTLIAVGALAVTLTATGCGGSSSGGGGNEANSRGCTPPSSAKPSQQQFSSEPKMTTEAADYTATLDTNCGSIVLTLDGKNAPHTVNSFAFLAGKHYFDNTSCHRLTTSGIYVLQCGDPTGSGSGGPGYELPDENLSAIKNRTYPAGTVAMANAGPNTGGSQFFLVYKDSPLDPNYTPFGTITTGLDILQKIAAAGSNPPGDGAPVQPVQIESFTVTKS
jgi:peptidyl-prolyl cis-trans isomerase B (cyclophilin B)